MNLYLRLFWTMFISKFKNKISILEPFISNHIVWPNDLDLLGHVNNGRYFTITDYVRIGCLMRAGIWKELRDKNILPFMAGETAQFRKPLSPFQKYKIKTLTVGWDDRFLYVEHVFFSKKGIHAILLVKIILVSMGNHKLKPVEALRSVHDKNIDSVKLNDIINTWNNSSHTHWSLHNIN